MLRLFAVETFFVILFSVIAIMSTQPAITCSKLTIETLEQGVSSVSIVNFEQVNAGWESVDLCNFKGVECLQSSY